jgi:hypothetical protein
MLETAKALMVFNKVDESLWGEAVRTAIYIANRAPHRAVDGDIPFTKFFGSKPDLSHLRTFGCAAYVHIPKERRSGKFGPHRQLVTFVGYPESQKAWKFFDTSTGKYIIGREATFLELNRFETITMTSIHPINSKLSKMKPPPSRPVKINPMLDGFKARLDWLTRPPEIAKRMITSTESSVMTYACVLLEGDEALPFLENGPIRRSRRTAGPL